MGGRIRLFWLILAVLFMAAAILACFYAGLFGSIYNQPGGNPGETVSRFFNGLRNGNYPLAYSCLSDYATLGLEQEPETAEAKLIYEAIRSSYSYSLNGESRISGREAEQDVTFSSLNLRKTEDAVAGRVDGILEEMVAVMPESEVYDGNGGYLTSLTDAVYAEALSAALQDTSGLTEETALVITLKYTGGEWKIVTDRALMNALVGGAS